MLGLTVGSVGWRCHVGLYLFLEGLNRGRSLELPKRIRLFSAQLSCGLRQVCSNGYTGVWSGDPFIVRPTTEFLSPSLQRRLVSNSKVYFSLVWEKHSYKLFFISAFLQWNYSGQGKTRCQSIIRHLQTFIDILTVMSIHTYGRFRLSNPSDLPALMWEDTYADSVEKRKLYKDGARKTCRFFLWDSTVKAVLLSE